MDELSSSSSRKQQITRAAVDVFLRYGYARTTMADIAKAAGVSRQTLYLAFSDKGAVFSAVIEEMVSAKLTDIRHGLSARSSLDAKLRFACESWGAEGYDLVRAHPDAKDMFDLGFKSVCDSYFAFEELLIEIVRAPLRESGLKITARELAHVISSAIKGFKETARDGTEIRKMIRAQVTLVSNGLRPGQSKRMPTRKR
jgi:AcrR family transcriptional regulator